MTPLIQVALGGAVGASARYLTGLAMLRVLGPGFPWATLLVNFAGSLAMGVLFVVLVEQGEGRFAPLLMTGLLGGFTTYSAFSLDAVALFERGQLGAALGYVALTLFLALGGVALGIIVTRGGLS